MAVKTTALLFCAFLIACSGSGPHEPEREPGPQLDPVALEAAREAAAVGEYRRALEIYLPVMSDTRDPNIIRQAAQLASATEDWNSLRLITGRWLELQPESRSAKQLAVIAALQQERVTDAVEMMQATIVTDAGADSEWMTAVALLSTAESSAAAAAGLEKLLASGGPHEAGFENFQRSRLAWHMDRPAPALELAEQAYRDGPGFERAMWIARVARADGQPDKAIRYFRAARLHVPPGSSARSGAALAESEMLRELGRSTEALQALEALPDSAETLYTRAVLQQELGRIETARSTWERLAALEPGEADASRHAWLTGSLADSLNMNEIAIDWYETVDGELGARAELRQAVVLGRLGELEAARELLADSRRRANSTLTEDTWLVEGQLLANAGQPRKALDLLSEALVKMPESTALLYSRAMLAVEIDDLSLAEQDLRASIQRDPDNAVALNALGYTLADRTDRQREALRLIDRALALEPENPAILDSMGWVLFKLGRAEQGLPYLRQAAELEPHPEIVAHLIEALWQLELRDQAYRLVERTRVDFADEPYFTETLHRLGID